MRRYAKNGGAQRCRFSAIPEKPVWSKWPPTRAKVEHQSPSPRRGGGEGRMTRWRRESYPQPAERRRDQLPRPLGHPAPLMDGFALNRVVDRIRMILLWPVCTACKTFHKTHLHQTVKSCIEKNEHLKTNDIATTCLQKYFHHGH